MRLLLAHPSLPFQGAPGFTHVIPIPAASRTLSHKQKRDGCHEMFGLVILPNRYEINKRLLPEIEKKLRMSGRKITWADVHFENYRVRLKKDERPSTRRLAESRVRWHRRLRRTACWLLGLGVGDPGAQAAAAGVAIAKSRNFTEPDPTRALHARLVVETRRNRPLP